MESIVYTKTQLASQLEDSRRRLEDEDRRRSMIEASLHQVSEQKKVQSYTNSWPIKISLPTENHF